MNICKVSQGRNQRIPSQVGGDQTGKFQESQAFFPTNNSGHSYA